MLLKRRLGLLAWLLTSSALFAASSSLRVVGSTTVNPVVVRAAEKLKAEKGLAIVVDTQGGSSGGITALADGRADVAMASRPLTDGDRTKYPKVDFRPVEIGVDALAVVVAKDVWEGGVRALSAEQLRSIYDGTFKNWQELGGPDRRIAFFNKEPGRGTWEVFVHWLYGDAKKAPHVAHLEVGSNEEARTKVASTPGGISQLSAAWADGRRVFPLAIRLPDGRQVTPTKEHLADGSYPLARPLLLITNGPPSATAKALLDYLLGPAGQELVRAAGYLGLRDGAQQAAPLPQKGTRPTRSVGALLAAPFPRPQP
ncbi:MAG: phosphate ABC transporter substrate-binding protein [Thermoanaerobaculia bacterium]|nr:phosphate ABC transporter substrate-binding protein [Thermoanaerobaculia bacterium]